ncbi:paraquat-inducible protein A [Uliginosibacterium sediminicola]|uniref:Paraquat-inducible protein A n=1 Tax=Uliginosibacterium sediminicola TaxID=2024550 RepID=A0ABU9Z2I9_9RHOO
MDKRHPTPPLIACHECDLLQQAVPLPRGGRLVCVRCGASLQRWAHAGIDRPLALTVAAGILFVLANCFPVMSLQFQALQVDASMLGAVRVLHEQGESLVGLLVLLTVVVAPALLILALLWLLLPLRLGWPAPGFARLFRVLMFLAPWSMLEVLMLGILVSLVKLGHMASATAGIGLWAYGGSMLLLTVLSASLQGPVLWAMHASVQQEPA